MNKYRFDQYDSVYEFDDEQCAYIFIGKLNGRTKKEFLAEYDKKQSENGGKKWNQ
jgi:hypothetical protein